MEGIHMGENAVAAELIAVEAIGPESFPLALLRATDESRVLPIWLTPVAAARLRMRGAGQGFQRPDALDLVVDLAEATGQEIAEVRIASAYRGVFHAVITFDSGVELDARASDAMALALAAELPILVERDVFAECGVFATAAAIADALGVDVPEGAAEGEEPDSASGDAAADREFEELMRSLGVSESDLDGDDGEGPGD